jgi:hypothetical protein
VLPLSTIRREAMIEYSDPAWPDEVDLQTDLSPSAWILPRLLPSVLIGAKGTPVASVVPGGFEAYARIFHPADRSGGRLPQVTWRDVTEWSGRVYHPTMQWGQISIPIAPTADVPPFVGPPRRGHLSSELCSALYGFLSAWSSGWSFSTVTNCWLGIWEGWGSLHYPVSMSFFSEPETDLGLNELAERIDRIPKFSHPHRRYLLARSPIDSVFKLDQWPLGITPSLAWSEDRAWFVGTEIDFDSTIVAGTTECITVLLSSSKFEALRVEPTDRLDSAADAING